MTTKTRQHRIRMYKLNFLEHTRTSDGRDTVATWLLANTDFNRDEVTEIVNNQLPPKQKAWPVEAVAKSKKKVAA